MAVTPNFSWPTPDDSDAVSQGAAAIRALGDAVDGTVAAQGTAIVGLDGRLSAAESDITSLEQGFRFAGSRVFESDGTFAKADPLGTGDIGLRAIRVRMVGGGGGGGGCDDCDIVGEAAAGGGGGGGAYAESFITDIAGLASSVTVTVGAGGSGGSGGGGSGNGSDGNDGTASSFGAIVIADGGDGARRGQDTQGFFLARGGVSSLGSTTGDIVVPSSGGGYCVQVGSQVTTTVSAISGQGGASMYPGGYGASISSINGSGAGENGTDGTGAGGSGSSVSARNATFDGLDGGDGGNGVVIVECYI